MSIHNTSFLSTDAFFSPGTGDKLIIVYCKQMMHMMRNPPPAVLLSVSSCRTFFLSGSSILYSSISCINLCKFATEQIMCRSYSFLFSFWIFWVGRVCFFFFFALWRNISVNRYFNMVQLINKSNVSRHAGCQPAGCHCLSLWKSAIWAVY